MQIPGALGALLGCFNHGAGPRGKGCLCSKGVPRHLYKGKPSGIGKVGAPRMLTKGDVKSISWGPIPPTSLGHAGQEMDEDPSVKAHRSLGTNPPSAYQCCRVY